MEKDTGARALRAILEEYMLDIMYEIPKDDNIGEVSDYQRNILKETEDRRFCFAGRKYRFLKVESNFAT